MLDILLQVYLLLLIIATTIKIKSTLSKPHDRKVDLGLLSYLIISSIFSVFTFCISDSIKLTNINSIYETLIIPVIFLSRIKMGFKYWFILNIVACFAMFLPIYINVYVFVNVVFLILSLIHHLFFQKHFNYLIHNIFLISVFVFSLLFDFFNIYYEIFYNSKYQIHVFILYSCFLYIFYTFIIFKYAKS